MATDDVRFDVPVPTKHFAIPRGGRAVAKYEPHPLAASIVTVRGQDFGDCVRFDGDVLATPLNIGLPEDKHRVLFRFPTFQIQFKDSERELILPRVDSLQLPLETWRDHFRMFGYLGAGPARFDIPRVDGNGHESFTFEPTLPDQVIHEAARLECLCETALWLFKMAMARTQPVTLQHIIEADPYLSLANDRLRLGVGPSLSFTSPQSPDAPPKFQMVLVGEVRFAGARIGHASLIEYEGAPKEGETEWTEIASKVAAISTLSDASSLESFAEKICQETGAHGSMAVSPEPI